MKSSPSIWHYKVDVKSAVKISSIFVAFLENMNFTIETKFGIFNFQIVYWIITPISIQLPQAKG